MSQQLRPGAKLGMIFGGLFFSLWSLLILWGVVGAALEASQLAHSYLAGGSARRMQESDFEWDWEAHKTESEICGLSILIFDLLIVFLYYRFYIKPTFTKFIPKNAVIPQDLMGRFKYDVFDCRGDCGTFCCFLWCAGCTMSDLWYRAGWIHTTFRDEHCDCDGWQYFAGVFGYQIFNGLLGHVDGCFPCLFAALRNGCGCMNKDRGHEGIGDFMTTKQMFGLPPPTCSDFAKDCCLYCWCEPCVATQEYRQVMAVLERGPPAVHSPSGKVVGNAVVVGSAPIQQTQSEV